MTRGKSGFVPKSSLQVQITNVFSARPQVVSPMSGCSTFTCAFACLHAAGGGCGGVGGPSLVCFTGRVGANSLNRAGCCAGLVSSHAGGGCGWGVGGARLVGFTWRVGAHPLHGVRLTGAHAGGRLGGCVGGAGHVGFAGRVRAYLLDSTHVGRRSSRCVCCASFVGLTRWVGADAQCGHV